MEHIKKYWWAYALLIVAAVVLYMNWTKWFGSSNEKPTPSVIEPGPKPFPSAEVERKK